MAGQTREQQGCLIKNSKSKVLMVVGVNYEVLPTLLSKLYQHFSFEFTS